MVTFAVVSWNTRELLDRCLASLAPEVEAGRAAVWVVDNASSDGSAGMVAERHPWAQLVRSDHNLGFGPAVNLVARRAERTDWIAPCNADVALEPGALAALVEAGERDARAGAVAPMLVGDDGRPQHAIFAFPSLALTLGFNLGLHRLSHHWADARCVERLTDLERPRRADWALGALLLARREAWDQAGGFDERQRMFAEDLDLGWRLQRAGWETLYEPRARVRHHGAAATGQAFGEARTERWMAATYAWMLRRRGRVRTHLYAGLNVAGAEARHALFAALAKLSPRWAGPRASAREWSRVHRAGLRAARARQNGGAADVLPT